MNYIWLYIFAFSWHICTHKIVKVTSRAIPRVGEVCVTRAALQLMVVLCGCKWRGSAETFPRVPSGQGGQWPEEEVVVVTAVITTREKGGWILETEETKIYEYGCQLSICNTWMHCILHFIFQERQNFIPIASFILILHSKSDNGVSIQTKLLQLLNLLVSCLLHHHIFYC